MKKAMMFFVILTVSLLLSVNSVSAALNGDFNFDGDVDGEDLVVFSENFGKTDDTCMKNSHCGRKFYCSKDPGDCKGIGQCIEKPEACTEIYRPVCGCDRRTYPNACYAAAAGVNVAYDGPCIVSEFNLDEIFSLHYEETKKNSGENIAIKFIKVLSDSRCPVEAVCVWEGNAEAAFTFYKANGARSFILNTALEPKEVSVFGYNIELVRLAPPASLKNPPEQKEYIAYLRITKAVTSCFENADCSEHEYCAKRIGDCDGTGLCTVRPDAVVEVWEPVCGCDGNTYTNKSWAANAGVNIAREGECRDTRCDDGTPDLCDMVPPECSEYEILAIQNNCWICVNPATCHPWGEPGCKTGADCPQGSRCDPCGTSSCPACEDCVPACKPGVDSDNT